uniref:Predicted protein n=1 Tax=Physcomitrium patens TaxID=3218 RepID=A9TZM5_PHYPA
MKQRHKKLVRTNNGYKLKTQILMNRMSHRSREAYSCVHGTECTENNLQECRRLSSNNTMKMRQCGKTWKGSRGRPTNGAEVRISKKQRLQAMETGEPQRNNAPKDGETVCRHHTQKDRGCGLMSAHSTREVFGTEAQNLSLLFHDHEAGCAVQLEATFEENGVIYLTVMECRHETLTRRT